MNSIKGILWMNAIVIGVSGLLLALLSQSFFINYFGINNSWTLPAIGCALMLSSAYMASVARSSFRELKGLTTAILLSSFWILLGFSVRIFDLFTLHPRSHALVLFMSLWLAMTTIQLIRLRKTFSDSRLSS